MAKTCQRLLLFQARRSSVLIISPVTKVSLVLFGTQNARARPVPLDLSTIPTCLLTCLPVVVLAFVAKNGLVDLDHFSLAAQLQVAM